MTLLTHQDTRMFFEQELCTHGACIAIFSLTGDKWLLKLHDYDNVNGVFTMTISLSTGQGVWSREITQGVTVLDFKHFLFGDASYLRNALSRMITECPLDYESYSNVCDRLIKEFLTGFNVRLVNSLSEQYYKELSKFKTH